MFKTVILFLSINISANIRNGGYMKNQKLAQAILNEVGGKENVKNLTHCVTRLRFVLMDESKINVENIKSLDEVIDVLKSSGQYQVVLGPIVTDIYKETAKLMGTIEEEPVSEMETKEKNWKSIPKNILDYVISCFVPAIPVFAGAGMVKVLAVILSSIGVLAVDSTTYTILNTIGDGIFYFLPFVVSINAANKLKVNPMLALGLAAILMHPDFTAFQSLESPATFCGISVTAIDYSSQALPMMFGVWLLSYVDKFTTKISPKLVSVFLVSMLDLLIVAPIMILAIGPIANYLNDLMFALCTATMSWGWLAVGLNAAIFPLMVLTGTHNASIPLIVQMFATQGFDPIFLVGGLAANIAEAGAACAVAVKTKNKKLKSTGYSATLSALLGITEPALYGVNLRLKRPLISMMIGSFVGGALCGIMQLSAPAFATPSLITCALFGPNGKVYLGFIAVLVVFVITFIITYLVGFKDIDEN